MDTAALASISRSHAVTLQWIPSHCNMPRNEAADSLAKEGTTKEQVDRSTSYPDVKTILKAKQQCKWRLEHPRYKKADPYYLLTRYEELTVCRLRTGHNHLNYLTYAHRSRWSIGQQRPLAIALCSGLLWSFRTSWSLAVSALLQSLASNSCEAGLSFSSPVGSRSGLGVWCWMLAS